MWNAIIEAWDDATDYAAMLAAETEELLTTPFTTVETIGKGAGELAEKGIESTETIALKGIEETGETTRHGMNVAAITTVASIVSIAAGLIGITHYAHKSGILGRIGRHI